MFSKIVSALDPAVSQAIATIAGAVSMLIISLTSYYFPRGHDRFDKEDDKHRHRHDHGDDSDDEEYE